MFLTRLGFNSKAVITGDITQIDLPDSQEVGSGRGRPGAAGRWRTSPLSTFTEKDVVRHKLVQDIIKAYEAAERRQNSDKTKRSDRKGTRKH